MLPEAARPVRPDVHFAHRTQNAGPDPFVREPGSFRGVALIAHLRGDAGHMGGLGYRATFMERAGERFLAVNVFACTDRCHGRDRMDVVWSAHRYGVDMLRLLVQHLAEVFVSACPRKCSVGAGGALVVDVAQGDYIDA